MKIRSHVIVFCGGQSTEHEVSVISGKNIIKGLLGAHYPVSVVFVSKNSQWFLWYDVQHFLNCASPQQAVNAENCAAVTIVPGNSQPMLNHIDSAEKIAFDIAFPILHGPCGEDGTIQGLFELFQVPFVGAGVLSSAMCMDKIVTKQILQQAGIRVARFCAITSPRQIDEQAILTELSLPVFVKPANIGSSVGISKVKNKADLLAAIKTAFLYDGKVLVEETIVGREIECAVLGNENPQASLPVQIIPRAEFYTYEAKYVDPNGAEFILPAKLDADTLARLQKIAVRAYELLNCQEWRALIFLSQQIMK